MLNNFFLINSRILLPLLLFGLLTGKIRQGTYRALFRKKQGDLVIDFFNLIGIPVHELCHLIMGLLFGYRIKKVCLYRRLSAARAGGGNLGYVRMQHKRNTFFQRLCDDVGQFFVGTGPVLLGPFLVCGILMLMPEQARSIPVSLFDREIDTFSLIRSMTPGQIFLTCFLIYAVIGISMNMELSRADLSMTKKGFVFLEILILIASLILARTDTALLPALDRVFRYLTSIYSVGIIAGLIAYILALL